MKPVGGYFELESSQGTHSYHPQALAIKNGRSALNLIIRLVNPLKIYLPFYCCDTLLEPILENEIPYEFYEIDENFEPRNVPALKPQEYYLFINYYGLKDEYSEYLASKLGSSLILDNTQAFFKRGNHLAWSFNSVRKFFGTPDGGYLYFPASGEYQAPENLEPNEQFIVDHLFLRLKNEVEQGYEKFLQNEALQNSEIKAMSIFSEGLLAKIDWDTVIARRIDNFKFYHSNLKDLNLLKLADEYTGVPYFYPLLLTKEVAKENFFKSGIYLPNFWPECLLRKHPTDKFTTALNFSSRLLPLPIDHRYEEGDLQRVVSFIKDL